VTKLQENVAVVTVLKEMLVLANVLMLQIAVNLDFSLKLPDFKNAIEKG
jgi:uncharacterized membrane protein